MNIRAFLGLALFSMLLLASPVKLAEAQSDVPEPPLIRNAPEYSSDKFRKFTFSQKVLDPELRDFNSGPAKSAVGGFATTKYAFRDGTYWKTYEPGRAEYSFSKPGMTDVEASKITLALLRIAGVTGTKWSPSLLQRNFPNQGLHYFGEVQADKAISVYWKSGMKFNYKVYVSVSNERD